MAIATVSQDGKVEIPKALLERLGVAAGDEVDLLVKNDELVVRKAKKSWRDLEGILHRPGQRPVSVEEMNEAIGDEIAQNYERFLRESKK